MPGNRAPSENRAGQTGEELCAAAALEIDYHQCPPGKTEERTQQPRQCVIGKVMEQKRAGDVIETPGSERKRECVRHNPGRCGRSKMIRNAVHGRDGSQRKCTAQSGPHVPRCRTDVHE